jgi:hypothetical protein
MADGALLLLAVLAGSLINDPAASFGRPTASLVSARTVVASTASAAVMVLEFGDESATATLDDTDAARQFAGMLPLQVDLHDPMGQAKSGRLPRPLTVTDPDRVLDPNIGEIYYSPADEGLVIFYDDLGQQVPPPGLVRLGQVERGLDAITDAGRGFTVRRSSEGSWPAGSTGEASSSCSLPLAASSCSRSFSGSGKPFPSRIA